MRSHRMQGVRPELQMLRRVPCLMSRTAGWSAATPIAARVASTSRGEHHGFVVIRRLKATPEDPFMIRRGDE